MRRFAPIVLLLVAAAPPPFCPERPPTSQDRPGVSERARTVVVFLDASGQRLGVGTLIDRDKRLILTAMHVVLPDSTSDASIQFRYAGDSAQVLHHGHLLWKTALAQTGTEDTGRDWDKPRDIAMVQDDDVVPPGPLVADVAPDIPIDEALTYSGVPEGGSLTQVANGQIEVSNGAGDPGYQTTIPATGNPLTEDQAQCTRSVARFTVPGMSGSALLTAAGRVAGVTIAEAGPGQSARYVRLTCFFDGISPQATAPTWLMDAIRTLDTANLMRMLQHSPNDATQPVTNMSLYAADEGLRAEVESSSTATELERRNVQCALIPVAYARNLSNAWGPRWNREAADGLQQNIAGLPGAEKQLRARQAVGLFLKALKPDFLTTPIAVGSAKQSFTPEELRTLSGLSDAAFIAAENEPNSPYMRIAAKAASAVILSSATSSPLVGKAFARFGEVAGLEGDYAASAHAFTEAQMSHYTPSWLWRAKADAVRLLNGGTAGGILTMNRVRDAANEQLPNLRAPINKPLEM